MGDRDRWEIEIGGRWPSDDLGEEGVEPWAQRVGQLGRLHDASAVAVHEQVDGAARGGLNGGESRRTCEEGAGKAQGRFMEGAW